MGNIAGVGSKYSKIKKGYRQDAAIAELIAQAARISGHSEADIVDACVEAQISNVLTRLMRRKHALRDKAIARALAQMMGK